MFSHIKNAQKTYDEGFHSILFTKTWSGQWNQPADAWMRLENIVQPTWYDLVKKENSLKFLPIMDTFGFLTTIKNTYAMWSVLFTLTSPLTQGLQELWKIILWNHHTNGQLDAISHCQSNWYAHVLWGVYECMDEFFCCHLSEQDLFNGVHLANPLTSLNQEVSWCTLHIWPKIHGTTTTASMASQSKEISPWVKCPGGHDDKDGKGKKKQKCLEREYKVWFNPQRHIENNSAKAQ